MPRRKPPLGSPAARRARAGQRRRRKLKAQHGARANPPGPRGGPGAGPRPGGPRRKVRAPGLRPGRLHPDRAQFARQAYGLEPLIIESDEDTE